jgi:hypothetical protein
MKKDIACKLSRELKDEIVSERQVVYILVETRKLLEQQGRLDDFRTLTLCCNWTVHPKLDRKDSQEVLKYFDGYVPSVPPGPIMVFFRLIRQVYCCPY